VYYKQVSGWEASLPEQKKKKKNLHLYLVGGTSSWNSIKKTFQNWHFYLALYTADFPNWHFYLALYKADFPNWHFYLALYTADFPNWHFYLALYKADFLEWNKPRKRIMNVRSEVIFP
jgi:hypothetical protein